MATQINVQNNVWDYFIRENDRYVKCKMCNEIVERRFAPVHLYRFHKITDQNVISEWNNDNHLIWQHFCRMQILWQITQECVRKTEFRPTFESSS